MEFHLIMWWLLIVVAIFILLSSLDELYFDIVFIINSIWKKIKQIRYNYQPLTLEQIDAVPEKKIAVMVACWSEHLVIEDMLKHNIPAIHYTNYNFFIGVYPNDPLTIEAVERAKELFSNIIPVVTKRPGPSTKADNLNNIYNYILKLEKEKNIKYEIFVFHDAEDVIHPLSLKLYNYLIPRKDMVQVPVFPLEVSHSFATHWTYNDEFAENHTRTMIAREVMGGLVTSAGVGTGFSRSAINLLSKESNGSPFNVSSFTEDYSVSLRIRVLKLKSIFLVQKIIRTQTRKKWWFFGKLVSKPVAELVATRALYPMRYRAAVRQRARWVMGITFQEWYNTGWPGDLATRYTLFHDRKAVVTHLINFMAYILFVYWLIYFIVDAKPTLTTLVNTYPFSKVIILACTLMMLFRLYQRAAATFRIYGLLAAFLSIPRSIYSNLINFHSLLRAYRSFFFTPKKDSKWDKTNNTFPGKSTLKKYKKKLGDLLLENKVITSEQLRDALKDQHGTQERLGKILIKNYGISPSKIIQFLANQYNLEIVDMAKFPVLKKEELEQVSMDTYNWLVSKQIFPIAYTNNVITLALTDPANEDNRKEAVSRLKPCNVKFVMSNAV